MDRNGTQNDPRDLLNIQALRAVGQVARTEMSVPLRDPHR
jgi:hypothetical protein